MLEHPKPSRVVHRSAAATAMVALFVGLLGVAAGGVPLTAEPVLTEPPTTTTTLLDGVFEPILEPIMGSSESEPEPTTTTTTTTTTTSTLPPASPDDSTREDPGGTTPSSEGPGAPATHRSGPTPVTPTAPPRPAAAAQPPTPGGAAAPVASAPPLAAPGAAESTIQRTRSVVLLDTPAVPPTLRGGRTTMTVLDQLAGLHLAPSVIARILAPFPVAGPATYTDDWAAVRLVPALHLHEGTDIFAARGTPVIASADGIVSRLTVGSPVGGTSLRLTEAAGSYFYYAHLDGIAPTLSEGKRVQRGDVVGFVGSTGNAEGTSPHLHYEIHLADGSAVNPAPYLDRWLADAAVTAAAVEGAPDDIAAALEARAASIADRGAVLGGGRSTGAEPTRPSPPTDPGAIALGAIQPIAASASAPFGVLLALASLGAVHRRMTRRRRHRRRAPATSVATGPPPIPWTEL